MNNKNSDKDLKNYFNMQLYPYLQKLSLHSKNNNSKNSKLNIKKGKLDLEEWINNGFDEDLYKRLNKQLDNIDLISLLDISVNLDSSKYDKYKDKLDHPNFVKDKLLIQLLKKLFYYIPDLLEINDICYIDLIAKDTGTEYFSNIKIDKYDITSSDTIKMYDLLVCNSGELNEYQQHKYILKFIIFMFNHLREGGSFIFNISNMYSNLTLELITIISRNFKEILYFKTDSYYFSNKSYLIFKEYRKTISREELNNLTNIVSSWKNESNKSNKSNKSNDSNNIYLNYKKADKKVDHIKSIGVNIDPKIGNYIKNINYDLSKNINIRLDNLDKILKSNSIKKINQINIDYTIQYCKMMSIAMVNQRDVMEYYTLTPLYFPIYNFNKNNNKNNKNNNKNNNNKNNKNNNNLNFIDPSKFKITKEGEYSVTFPVEANIISNIISSFFGNNITILDGTSNVGGNVISFSRYFEKVIGIELDKDNFNALKDNIKLYDIKNVELINGNTLDYLRSTKYDLLFLDPPWGGTNYKRHSVLDLKLGHLYMGDIISQMKQLGKKGIVFKLPKNFRITQKFLLGDLLSIYRIKNYYCAIIRL